MGLGMRMDRAVLATPWARLLEDAVPVVQDPIEQRLPVWFLRTSMEIRDTLEPPLTPTYMGSVLRPLAGDLLGNSFASMVEQFRRG